MLHVSNDNGPDPSHNYTFRPGVGFSQPSPREQEIRLIRQTGNTLGLTLLLFLLLGITGFALVAKFVALFWPGVTVSETGGVEAGALQTAVITSLSYTLKLLLPFLLYTLMLRMPISVALPFKKSERGLTVPAVLIGLGASVLGAFGGSVVIEIVRTLFSVVPVAPTAPIPEDPALLLMTLVNYALLPAILEEMVFRGIVMQSLRRFGDTFALIVSSGVFMMAHLNFAQAVPGFVMGLLIGYFVMRTGSLWVGMAMHFCNNLMVIGLQAWAPMLPDGAASLMYYVAYAVVLGMALVAVILICRKYDAMFWVRTREGPLPNSAKMMVLFSSLLMLVFMGCVMFIFLSNMQAVTPVVA